MTVIVSGGKSVTVRNRHPIPAAPGSTSTEGASPGRVGLAGNRSATYEGMYRSQPWVFAAVNKLSYAIARLPLKVYRETADGERQRDRGGELATLVKKPFPRARSWQMKLHVAGDLLVHGKALTVLYRGNGAGAPPTEWWPVPWPFVEVVRDSNRQVLGYNVVIGGQTVSVRPENAVYYELLHGVSPLEPLRRTLAIEDAALDWSADTFDNGVTPRGAFVAKGSLRPPDFERLRAELTKLYVGPSNYGRFGLFDSDLKWEAMGQSAVDAELVNQRKLNREEVAAAYDVSPPLLGILDRATFNNVELLHSALYVDSIGPKLELIEETTMAQLVDPVAAWDGAFVEFDVHEILRPDPVKRAQAHLMGQQSSTWTIDERRRSENLPALGVAGVTDTVLVPANMIPAGATAPEIEARARLLEAVSALRDGGVDAMALLPPVAPGDTPGMIPSNE